MELKDFCSMGGKARAAKLSKARLTEIAKLAASVRWLLNRSIKAQDKLHVEMLTKSPNLISDLPKPKPEPKTCQVAYCTKEGFEHSVKGLRAWLCVEHGGGV